MMDLCVVHAACSLLSHYVNLTRPGIFPPSKDLIDAERT